jgi:FixJ family two-component response regulator
MQFVVNDMVNKHVGSKLDINEITWKVHKGNVIQKMSADSVVDLVEIGARLGLTPTRNLWQNR